MKAAIYARKSKYSVTSDSVENQLELCKRLAISLGIDESNIFYYEDDGVSGATDNRSGYQLMINDIIHEPNNFTHLICYKIDRLSRNVYDFANLLKTLKSHNIQLKSYSDSFDANTISGEAMCYILSVFSQLERELISSRIKDNMYAMAKAGRWLGGNYPFGFKSKKIQIYDSNFNEGFISNITPDENKVDIIKLIFSKYLELESIKGVTSYAYDNNLLSDKGNNFQDSTIRKILRNPVYVKSSNEVKNYLEKKGFEVIGIVDEKHGFLTYSKTSKNYSGQVFEHQFSESDVDIDNSSKVHNALAVVAKHEGIIDSKTWLSVQNILDRNYTNKYPRTGTGVKGILCGLLKCSECNNSMNITYSTKRLKDGSKKNYYYYTCSRKVHIHPNACTCKAISIDKIDPLVSKAISNLTIEDIINYIKNYKSKLFNDKTYIQNKIYILEQDIEQRKTSLKRLIHNMSIIEDDTVIPLISAEIAKCNKQIKDLQTKLDILHNEAFNINKQCDDINKIINDFSKFEYLFNNSSIERQRNLLKLIIEKVTWNSNNNELTIYYKDNKVGI